MKVDHVPRQRKGSEAERAILKSLLVYLEGLASPHHYVLFSNLAFPGLSEEVDLIAVGTTALKVIEVQNWDHAFLLANDEQAKHVAHRVTSKAKWIAGQLRTTIPDVPHLAGCCLLADARTRFSEADRPVVAGVSFYAFGEWREMLGLDDPERLRTEEIKGIRRVLQELSAGAPLKCAPAREVAMTTKMQRSTSNILHPIVFFEQGTSFFEMRQRIDGDWLIRQYFGRQLELECGLGEDVQNELKRLGIPILAALRWNEATKTYDRHPNEEEERRKALEAVRQDRLRERQRVRASAATTQQASVLVIDPLEPTRHIEEAPGKPARLQYPLLDEKGENPDFRKYGKFWAFMKSKEISQDTWHLLAFVDSYELKALRSAVGRLPPGKLPEQTDEEWLLRYAFSDDRVRARPGLAMVLARLPMLFSKASTNGHVEFQHEGIPRGDYSICLKHWVVAVLDTTSEPKERS